MAGYVWEWTWDWYLASYYGTPESLTNPHGPVSGSARVLRGGDWDDGASYCRSAYRYGINSPGNSYSTFGFRSVRR
jgi:formylglycine-generating enzyme required for sulfatase activity